MESLKRFLYMSVFVLIIIMWWKNESFISGNIIEVDDGYVVVELYNDIPYLDGMEYEYSITTKDIYEIGEDVKVLMWSWNKWDNSVSPEEDGIIDIVKIKK